MAWEGMIGNHSCTGSPSPSLPLSNAKRERNIVKGRNGFLLITCNVFSQEVICHQFHAFICLLGPFKWFLRKLNRQE